jgi:fructose-1,6-bisphosphatase/inositol monophosphatase family enzyme
MLADTLLDALHRTTVAVRRAVHGLEDRGLEGSRPGQYNIDLVADSVAVEVLEAAGLGVLSEESGLHRAERELLAVLDPVDGSTNASRGLPWWATSVCVLDAEGPVAAVVVNQVTGTCWDAVRGRGARCDGRTMAPSGCTRMSDALVGLSGLPGHHLGWRQFRAFGAAALDMCAVASGVLDAFVDCAVDAHGPWDYLGGLLICREAGAAVADAEGRDLVVRDRDGRRTPVAAATSDLLAEVLAAVGRDRDSRKNS